MTSFDYPDLDYPPGHPERVWGMMAVEGDKEEAERFILSEFEAGRITEDEKEHILRNIGRAPRHEANCMAAYFR